MQDPASGLPRTHLLKLSEKVLSGVSIARLVGSPVLLAVSERTDEGTSSPPRSALKIMFLASGPTLFVKC
jgi:hypothetical protein